MLGLDAGGAQIRHSLFTYFRLKFDVYTIIVLELEVDFIYFH